MTHELVLERPPQLATLPTTTIEYAASDGKPMAETGFHVTLMVYLIAMLRAFFRHRADVYIGGNMFVYYEEGNTDEKVAPDIFVVFGVPKHERRSWFVWKEGKTPEVVFELTSRSTKSEDQWTKKGLYEELGIQEYFLFDPLGDYLRPPLQGYRLVEGKYQALPLMNGQMESEQLGLWLQAAKDQLNLIDRNTGERILPPLDMAGLLAEAQAELQDIQAELLDAQTELQATQLRLEQETATRRAAEAEVARLREELAHVRGQ